MDTSNAFLAGVVAGLAMSVIMALGRALGVPIDVEMMLGTLIGLAPGTIGTWIVGLVMHLVISGLIALIYAWGFENVTHRADWGTGALFSIVHIIIGGLAMGLMPFIHPMIPEIMAAPGVFAVNLGTGAVLLFLVGHLVYGAFVGGIYATAPSRAGARSIPV